MATVRMSEAEAIRRGLIPAPIKPSKIALPKGTSLGEDRPVRIVYVRRRMSVGFKLALAFILGWMIGFVIGMASDPAKNQPVLDPEPRAGVGWGYGYQPRS